MHCKLACGFKYIKLILYGRTDKDMYFIYL